MEFNYKKLGLRFYPIIPLQIIVGDLKGETDALLDSGAGLSLFTLETAKQLRIDYKTGIPKRVATVSGNILAYICNLKLKINDKEYGR